MYHHIKFSYPAFFYSHYELVIGLRGVQFMSNHALTLKSRAWLLPNWISLLSGDISRELKYLAVFPFVFNFSFVIFLYFIWLFCFDADATQFAPDVDKENKFYVFSPEICR